MPHDVPLTWQRFPGGSRTDFPVYGRGSGTALPLATPRPGDPPTREQLDAVVAGLAETNRQLAHLVRYFDTLAAARAQVWPEGGDGREGR